MPDTGQAVIAMRDARDELMLAEAAAIESPSDPAAQRRVQDANREFDELSIRVVPRAMRAEPIPLRRFNVVTPTGKPSGSEWVTVALVERVNVRVVKGGNRERALMWLRGHGYTDVVRTLLGPFSNKLAETKCWRQTLSRFVEDQRDGGAGLDLKVLGITVSRIAHFLKRD
jgi:hypothetical protein